MKGNQAKRNESFISPNFRSKTARKNKYNPTIASKLSIPSLIRGKKEIMTFELLVPIESIQEIEEFEKKAEAIIEWIEEQEQSQSK